MELWKNMSSTSRWALGIFAALVVWFASGLIFKSEPKVPGEVEVAAGDVSSTVPQVATARVTPQAYERILTLNGASEALVRATVSAQTAGRVNSVQVVRGDEVTKGQVLVTLDAATRNSDVRAAKANYETALQLANSARELAKGGYFSNTQLAEREAQLASAKEALARVQQDLAYTQIKAPVDGVVEDTPVVVGDFVNVGGPVARVVQRDELLIVAYAGQNQRADVPVGASATVTLANGDEAPATVRFVATDADEATRTYRVEAVVDGKTYPIPTGMTASLHIPVATVAAYRVSHSTLVLGDEGQVALMHVAIDEKGQRVAKSQTVEILSDDGQGVWLAAPVSDTLEVIVRGQAGLSDGAVLPSATTVVKEKGGHDDR